MKLNAAYGSHLSMLIPLIQKTSGDVLEIGMGFCSTPVIHELCRDRKIVSYENHRGIYDTFASYEAPWHEIHLIDNWDSMEIDKPWSIALIDHAPARRRRHDLMRLKDFADYIIIHDTEDEVDKYFRIKGRFRHFKFVKPNELIPQTTIVSNKYPI